MKYLAALAILLSACATPGPELFVACRAADTATTLYGVHHGFVEANPALHALVAHPALFIAFEAAIAWYVAAKWKSIPETYKPALTVISCVPPALNVMTLGGG